MNEGVMKIGINGLGRIGKSSVWHHVGRRYFNEIVVNIGRQAGTGLKDVAHYLERDSTYVTLHPFTSQRQLFCFTLCNADRYFDAVTQPAIDLHDQC